ncbi:hypothetical protein RRG08_016739 [Elysia crispata]|uniref:Uncharacterized protein n=1 Tax=Elysia crispata TaxID=231223 RepID=A0AAE0ZWE9_9GAST|nr:hypothetical protein RRG08_016739 [Elysia crispata]
MPRNLLTVDLRSRQRSDDGTPESGRLNRRIGEELSTTTSTNKRDDGEKPDGVTVENHGTRLGKKLKIPEEYGIEIKNKFGMLMAVEEEMGPDELATHAQQILLTTAKNRIPKGKQRDNHGYQIQHFN